MGCTESYIKNVCNGRCCWTTDKDGKPYTIVYVEKEQREEIKKRGGVFDKNGVLVTKRNGKCRFQSKRGLCKLHNEFDSNGVSLKPRSCSISPWFLTGKNKLTIRNRYKMFDCYVNKDSRRKALPVYKAFKTGLVYLFGDKEASKIVKHFDSGDGDYTTTLAVNNVVLTKGVTKRWRDKQSLKSPVKTSQKLQWVCGDALDCLHSAPMADFIFSCPPYDDLEVYSKDSRDLSNMKHSEFMNAYREIIRLSCDRLKDNRFACFVVSDFRDKNGHYRNFVSKTTNAFLKCGLHLYNDAVLLNVKGTAGLRCNNTFTPSRKLVKVHQNVLIFVKGGWKKAVEYINERDNA